MANYKRFVSYIYEYENGEKKKNVGYARVEIKNGECKFTIHMQSNGIQDGIFPTYLIYRPSDKTELIYLGDSMAKNRVIDSRLTVAEKNIKDSGYGFSDMGGLLLFLNSNVFYATRWDDKPVILEEVLDALKPKPKPEARPEPDTPVFARKPAGYMPYREAGKEDKTPDNPWELVNRYKKYERENRPAEPEAANEEENKKEIREETRDEINKDTNESGEGVESETKAAPREADNGEEAPDKQQTGMASETVDEINTDKVSEDFLKSLSRKPAKKASEMAYEKTIDKPSEISAAKTDKDDKTAAARIFATYPKINPFEDGGITRCVKIEPKDIGLLPSGAWPYSSNSFLLHGYYCYHHLIFAEISDRFGIRYMLGVPGIYHHRERFMARMFGFDCFKPIRNREPQQGDFGYWYIEIRI